MNADDWESSITPETWAEWEPDAFNAGFKRGRESLELKESEAYAAEGWSWVEELLKLGGWKDVFQARDALRALPHNFSDGSVGETG
jgi:hypothetical protein